MTETVGLKSAVKTYGEVEAVQDVSLSLSEGEIVALVGHNGAGKTTLIKLMLGLSHPTAGTLRVLGHDPLSRAGQRARLDIGDPPCMRWTARCVGRGGSSLAGATPI